MTKATNQSEMKSFEPGENSDQVFRAALSRYGTGVTIVTTMTPLGPVGITANSFSSVSLDPPLVLWSVSLGSKRYSDFAQAEDLAIHILAHDQDTLCWAFSKSKAAFDQADWEMSDHGTPMINGCLARFECKKYATYDGGDHAIIVSRVTRISSRDGQPLLFFGGNIGKLELPDQLP
jgi:flavin reductase (DIM6/NTAB) family NADH-FMN oxidoreductase RutF